MPLSILIRLTNGRYDAGGDRPSDSEWPPHPARVFCALAASASTDADWAALRWLEEQPPPHVWADPPGQVSRTRTRAYVVQNATEHGGGNITWPGRTNGLRTRASAVPSRDAFAIVWPHADPPAGILTRLNMLAWNVPYVGRSTSTTQVSAVDSLPDTDPETTIYQPADLGQHGQLQDLRVPYPGYADALQGAYADGARAWEVARRRPYTAARPGGDPGTTPGTDTTASGPFSDLLAWRIDRPVARVSGDLAVSLASGLRRAVMSRVSRITDVLPGQVSGHTEPGRPHVAFLALPDTGHQHADGHLLGLAVAVPRDMPEHDLTILLRALLTGDELREIRFPDGRPLALTYGSDLAGLRPARWTGGAGAKEWVTVTPVMLDGHVRRGHDEAAAVARSLVTAGYPEPAQVDISPAPLVAGGIWRPKSGTLPPGRPRRQMLHARIRFDQPVTGPVLAGSMRYIGLGLFRPASHSSPQPADPTSPARQPFPARSPRRGTRELAEVGTDG
jgi:CRISPR-associated protein Csb2